MKPRPFRFFSIQTFRASNLPAFIFRPPIILNWQCADKEKEVATHRDILA